MVEYKNQLNTDDIRNIRNISELRFASNLAPAVSDGYLHTDHNGIYVVNRLPADDDPMMARVLKVREREYMLVDTLNEYYADYYDEMWEPYQNWRKANRVETEALREVRNASLLRKTLGVAAVAAAIPLAMIDRGALLMILAGMYAYKSGMDKDKDAEIHEQRWLAKPVSDVLATTHNAAFLPFGCRLHRGPTKADQTGPSRSRAGRYS